MTRLEAGAVAPNLVLQDVSETVDTALRRTEKVLARHRIVVQVAPDLPALRLDPVLFEQVLVNLLDNAAKYAPEGTTVVVRAFADGGRVRLEVLDEGEGLPEADVERVFDKFYRARKGDHVRAGTGLGLAISRGFVEAMGGTIIAANRTDRSGAGFPAQPAHPRAFAQRGPGDGGVNGISADRNVSAGPLSQPGGEKSVTTPSSARRVRRATGRGYRRISLIRHSPLTLASASPALTACTAGCMRSSPRTAERGERFGDVASLASGRCRRGFA